jgi:hypothetical protein
MKAEILWAVLLDPLPVEARYSCGSYCYGWNLLFEVGEANDKVDNPQQRQ